MKATGHSSTAEAGHDLGSTAEILGEEGFSAWKAFLRAHSRLIRQLDDELQDEHGFALGDFDVMIQLAEAPRGRRRMCDLAEAVLLSPSGLSRRVDRLERAGYVVRERAEDDARAVEARLTANGKRLLARLHLSHVTGVRERFVDPFTTTELETLADLLDRLRP